MVQKIKKHAQNLTENYYKPTPKLWRKVGDIILTFGTTLTSISAVTMPPWVTVTATILTWAGKSMTNFFSE